MEDIKMEDNMSLLCTGCGSEDYKKNGSYKGVQRYHCKSCGMYFSTKPRKFSYVEKKRALDMYMNNVGIRKIARFIGASPALIVRWIRDFGNTICRQVEEAKTEVKNKLPDIIEMDEIYTFVKKNSKEQSYGLLILGRNVVLLRTSLAIEE
jgi:transposase-like protein